MESYHTSIQKQFTYYKSLGDKTFEQLQDEQLFHQMNNESNSIAIIVKHLSGNMLSIWTNFLTTDGEKTWRNRDDEFTDTITTKEDFQKEVYIRNMGHTVVEAINRQLAHYAYHIGQIVFIGKMLANDNWSSLSIPKGNSKTYNTEKFNKTKRTEHFTDNL
jgi:hypothetical protein